MERPLREVANAYQPGPSSQLMWMFPLTPFKTLSSALMEGPVTFNYLTPCRAVHRLDEMERRMAADRMAMERRIEATERRIEATERELVHIKEFTWPLVFIPLRTLVDWFLLQQGFEGTNREEFMHQNKEILAAELDVDPDDLCTLFRVIREEGINAAHETTSKHLLKAIQECRLSNTHCYCLMKIYEFAFREVGDDSPFILSVVGNIPSLFLDMVTA